MATKTIRADRSSVWADLGGPGLGGGQDFHLPVSNASGNDMRGGIGFPLPSSTWDDIGVLRKTELRLKTTDQVHVAFGGTPEFTVRRITQSWTPNAYDDDNPPGPGGDDWQAKGSVHPGPSTTSTGAVTHTHAKTELLVITKDISAIGLAWAPASVVDANGKPGGNAAKHGVMLLPRSGSAYATEFISAEQGSGYPELILTYDTKASLAPGAPSPIQPVGALAKADVFKFSFGGSSATPTGFDLQVAKTEDFAAPMVYNIANSVAGLTGKEVAHTIVGVTWARDTLYYWRARGRNGELIGPWCATASFTWDASGVQDAYDLWAGTILSALSRPRRNTELGELYLEGPDIATVLGAEYRDRWRIQDTAHPPAIDRIVEVMGVSFHLDFDGGWQIEAATHDVEG